MFLSGAGSVPTVLHDATDTGTDPAPLGNPTFNENESSKQPDWTHRRILKPTWLQRGGGVGRQAAGYIYIYTYMTTLRVIRRLLGGGGAVAC